MIGEPGSLGILVAALGGAAIGIERQRSGHASGPHARFGGIRTFTLLGGIAGIAGWLTTLNLFGLAIVLGAGRRRARRRRLCGRKPRQDRRDD